MMTKRRWLKSAIAEATKNDIDMPWARGARREAWKSGSAKRATEIKARA